MRFTLRSLIALLILICLAAVLAVPAIYRAQRNAKVTACISNLSNLWKMQEGYRGEAGFWKSELRSEFFLFLAISTSGQEMVL